MGVPALAQAASFSEHCSNVAAGIFLRHFANETIRLSNPQPDSFDILKHFGHSISKLSLNFYRNVDNCTTNEAVQYGKLLQLVNQYSQNSLIEFEIRYDSDCILNIFEEIKGPFDRVEKVSLQLTNTTIKADKLQLNTIFPRVHHLDLNLQNITDLKFVDGEYRYLDELIVAGRLLDKSLDDTFKNLLRKNKRIRLLSVTSPTYRTFYLINDYLKNLDELHIRQSIKESIFQKRMTLSRIKKLDIRLALRECNQPRRVSFSSYKMEELVLHCAYIDIDENYFKFLTTYSRVKRLTAGVEFNNEMLLKLVGKFSILSKAHFSFRNDVTVDAISRFVKAGKRLNVLTFLYMSNANPADFAKQLEMQLGEDFRVKFNGSEAATEFVVERKVPIDSATKTLAFSAFILFVILHINRMLFI